MTTVIWMSNLAGSQVHPSHGGVHLYFSHVMQHSHSTKSKHSHERLYSTISLKTSELQEQRLSSLHLADTFLMFVYLLFITFPFPKSKMLVRANSEPHENFICQFKCLVRSTLQAMSSVILQIRGLPNTTQF